MTVTKSEQIREFAKAGMSTADIARAVGVRYQFAYNVLKHPVAASRRAPLAKVMKPPLSAKSLRDAGFEKMGCFSITEHGRLAMPSLPREPGVYAFVLEGFAVYVGVATRGIAKRLYLYGRPGPTQTTSIRLNSKLCELVSNNRVVDIYVAMPSDDEWNGLPIDRCAGLELGLIRFFHLPWNFRSSK